MKKAIRYLRFSKDGQSNGSIERQEMVTAGWIEHNKAVLVDTFIDRGKSARSFDRPDFLKLQEFVRKYSSSVDYLLVDTMDRFSRDAGEAMVQVKKLQKTYSIQIVSVSEGIVFDCNEPGSTLRTGLQLLLAEEDNINRANKINGGIYAAKAKEGRYIHNFAPFGYNKVGEGKSRHLEIDEAKAIVIRFVFEAYLRNMPYYMIKQESAKMGMVMTGNSAMQKILDNPIYTGRQLVKPYKNLPGGLYPAQHEPIIDPFTWEAVQQKRNGPPKESISLATEMPLRGVLKCHCGLMLTGAPSKGKTGNYWYYYKCRHNGHNNISAKKAKDQLEQMLELLSVPESTLTKIRANSEQEFELQLKNRKLRVADLEKELDTDQQKLTTVEDKFFSGKVNEDTYGRWSKELTTRISQTKARLLQLGEDQYAMHKKMYGVLDRLTDLKFVYKSIGISDGQELLNLGFDRNLFYKEGIYRTPTLLNILSHNELKLREKRLLFIEKKGDFFSKVPLGGVERESNPVQTSLPLAFYMLISLLIVGI
jgi:site-specific DNA recombinase